MNNRRRAAALGSLVLTAALTLGMAAPASAGGLWERFDTLKACEKGRKVALANPYWDVVGTCQKTKPSNTYALYMYHY